MQICDTNVKYNIKYILACPTLPFCLNLLLLKILEAGQVVALIPLLNGEEINITSYISISPFIIPGK